MKFLRRLFESEQKTPPLPEHPLAVIGDLHGRSDLLEEMIGLIAETAGTAVTLVFVGDYIDRGEDSAGVLGLLQALQSGIWPADVICLKGNHETMMLEFLDAPEEAGVFWLKNGGASTLASYGLALPDRAADALRRTSISLREALPDRTEAWLRRLPSSYRSGNVFVAHAGVNPHAPLERQDDEHMLWGHPDFLTTSRRDTAWVVHGHWICLEPKAENGRISVDTGAYATDRLTAALIWDGSCRFIHTERMGVSSARA